MTIEGLGKKFQEARLARNLTVEAGYSHFWAGDYLSDTGASDARPGS